jgi:2-hydroxy-3-keto-5-methylthiopentenyl-1-phosphate phosphatase
MNRLILCDFDGTVSLQDMGYLILTQFSSGDWEQIDRQFCEGKIGSKEAYSRIAKILRGNEEGILNFVKAHSEIDPYFKDFYQYCRDKSIDVKIISDGFDFYIKPILEQYRLSEIPFYSNGSHFLRDKEMNVLFPYLNEDCGLCGTCKKRLVQIHRKLYDSILFIGNGLSDRCAAQEADFVFAKDSLYPYCIDREITCHFFHDFHDILADLKKIIRGVIFDLDGTLIEAYETIYLGLKEALQHFRKEIFPFNDLKQYLKVDLEATLTPFFTPGELETAVSIMRRKYEEVYLNKTHLLDGSREVLEDLHARGILLGVASNKLGRFSRGALTHLGVAKYFKSIIGAGDVLRNKPFPDMIHAALNEMKLASEEVVFVGDTLSDIETGKRAGVDVYALATGFLTNKELSKGKPKRILKNLEELTQLINSLSFPHLPVS